MLRTLTTALLATASFLTAGSYTLETRDFTVSFPGTPMKIELSDDAEVPVVGEVGAGNLYIYTGDSETFYVLVEAEGFDVDPNDIDFDEAISQIDPGDMELVSAEVQWIENVPWLYCILFDNEKDTLSRSAFTVNDGHFVNLSLVGKPRKNKEANWETYFSSFHFLSN